MNQEKLKAGQAAATDAIADVTEATNAGQLIGGGTAKMEGGDEVKKK